MKAIEFVCDCILWSFVILYEIHNYIYYRLDFSCTYLHIFPPLSIVNTSGVYIFSLHSIWVFFTANIRFFLAIHQLTSITSVYRWGIGYKNRLYLVVCDALVFFLTTSILEYVLFHKMLLGFLNWHGLAAILLTKKLITMEIERFSKK